MTTSDPHQEDDGTRIDAAEPPPSHAVRVIDSDVLLSGERFALINHRGVTYRLQTTRAGKLILTK